MNLSSREERKQLKIEMPIYQQIARWVEEEIISDRLQANDQVPSTNEFSKIMQVNPATAGKGLKLLVDQGLLYKKRGLGMFVCEGAKKQLVARGQREFFEKKLPACLKEAEQLGIGKETIIQFIKEESSC